ncbi:MAG TPA: hypothetical protein VKX16_13400 [Chloroflexota bacterium]|nr:hypothetical protein [Chloroflexota bacterium]
MADRIASDATRPVSLAFTDSGSVPLHPGTHVTLVCPRRGVTCPAGTPVGPARPQAHPRPTLQIVVPQDGFQPDSVKLRQAADGTLALDYVLKPQAADQWCAFTRTHTKSFSAFVLNDAVLTDPQISSPICRGETEITGLGTEVRKVAAYLTFVGPKGGAARIRPRAGHAPLSLVIYEPLGFHPDCLSMTAPPLCYSPAVIWAAYDIQPVLDQGIDGTGRTVSVIAASGSPSTVDGATFTLRASVRAFDHVFGLPKLKLDAVSPFGASLAGGVAEQEALLDVETIHLVAPDAAIKLVIPNTGIYIRPRLFGSPAGCRKASQPVALALIRAMRYAVQRVAGDVMAVSFGFDSSALTAPVILQLHRVLESAAKKRVTVVAGSGDWGVLAPTCGVPAALHRGIIYPAGDPLVTAVGGTTLRADPLYGSYESETAWNETYPPSHRHAPYPVLRNAGTGGGTSDLFRRPTYQSRISAPGAGRAIPDVALGAGDLRGFPVVLSNCRGTGVASAGGTSAAAPAWAAIVALADQYAHRRLGSINATLYQIGDSSAYRAAFRDVTRGNNSIRVGWPNGKTATVRGYHATPGWDPVTGWGTPRVATLIPLIVRSMRPPPHQP